MAFPVALKTITVGSTSVELFLPDEVAVKQAYDERKIPFPYWSKIWPSAIALGELIVQHPNYVQNKKLVELGAGLGLPSIVAARYADSVLCTDYIEEAVTIAQQSATHHRLTNFKTAIIDWHYLPNNIEADVLLLSDLNYEPAIFDRLIQVVNDFLRKGTTVFISTPQRLMAKDFIALLLPDVIEQEEIVVEYERQRTTVAVLVLALEKIF